MADYRIELGVKLRDGAIQNEINEAQKTLKPIELKVDAETKELTNTIREALNSLSKGTKNALTIDTSKIEVSLDRLSNTITDIKTSLGTLDSKSGMKDLLSSINQIATALAKVENESDSLVKSLSALSKKDFSIKFGFNMGKSASQVASEQGDLRRDAISQLKQQAKALEDYFDQYYKVTQQGAGVAKLTQGTNVFRDYWELSPNIGDTKATLKQQVATYKQYIDLMQKAAKIKGINLSGVTSGFSKAADDIVKETSNAANGVEQLTQAFKGLLGGGISSEQLDSIAADLKEIKIALTDLSNGININEITQSFKEMSVVLDDITNNLVMFRNAFGNIGNGLSSSVSNATQGLKNNANILDTFKRSLQNIGMEDDKIDVVANRIKNLGVQIETLNQSKTKDDILTVDISGIDKFGNAIKLTEQYNAKTGDLIKSVDKVSTVHQKAGKSAETFAKQQQRAVTDLTNQINQLNRAATDQNAARPIKESSHLDSLESKYNEIISAIERMGAASNDTFEAERNKVKTLITEYKSLKSEYKNAENVALQMDGNDFASGLEIAKNNLAKFKAEAQGFSQLTPTIKELDAAIEGVGDVSSLKEFNNQLRVAKSELSKVKVETSTVSEIKFKLDDTGFDGFEQEVARARAAVNALKNSTPELQMALKQLDIAMDAVNSANEANDMQRLVLANKDYELALKQVYSQLKMNQQAERAISQNASFEAAKEGALLRLKSLFSENSEAAKLFGSRLNEIQRELNECGDTRGLTEINRKITNLNREIKNADIQTQTFGQRFKKQWQQYSSYLSVASLFQYAERGLRSMFEQVKLIDSAMTELKKVTNETDAAYDKFLTNAASRAREIGTTIDGLVSSTADFARLGYGFEDAQGLAEVANIYAVVGDEIEGVEGATESLISTMAAFKDEMNGMSNTDFAMSIIDKFNEIGNNFAISSGGIGEALERSASSLMAANNTIDESIALITSANQVVQNPESVGNALKTISMRIRGAKTELEEMGEDTTGMVDSTAKLRQEIMALSGVDIMLNENEFKSTYQIMDELAQKWEDLSDIQQATITELIAGRVVCQSAQRCA